MDRTQTIAKRHLCGARIIITACLLLAGVGCETDSWLDPSVVGRWERTPILLPILESFDIVDEPESKPPGLSPVLPEDLIYEPSEYVIAPNDLVTITVYELLTPNVDAVQTVKVSEFGEAKLQVLGRVKISGFTANQLERELADLLVKRGILRDPQVTVVVQEGRQRTFSVIGAPSPVSTVVGTYSILRNDFRMLDAVALARGVPGTVKLLYVIRQIDLEPAAERVAPATPVDAQTGQPAPGPEEVLERALRGEEGEAAAPAPPPAPRPPQSLEKVLDQPEDDRPWVRVGDTWQKASRPQAPIPTSPQQGEGTAATALEALPDPSKTQRVIEIPYDKLQEGDLRYNIVIRPGDIIRVPPPRAGNVYAGGSIARPGTYALPGDTGLTIKQLVTAAGGLGGQAIPERVDLVRRIGRNQEAMLRLNLREIYDGVQPDVFLKPNDQLNFGTSAVAVHLATIRNSIRVTMPLEFNLTRMFSLPRDPFGSFTDNEGNTIN